MIRPAAASPPRFNLYTSETVRPHPRQIAQALPAPAQGSLVRRSFRAGSGAATLAFVLLVLCGISGAAVIDPALGSWSAAISARAEGLRASRALSESRRLAAATRPIVNRRVNDPAPSAFDAPLARVAILAAPARERAVRGEGALAPPANV